MLVSTRMLGKRKPLLADFSVDTPAELDSGGEVRLRDVIEHVVRNEVTSVRDRQQARRFDRVIASAKIDENAARGKIDPAGKILPALPSADDAVSTALLAFEDGMYLVIVDEIERRDLDEPVRLSEDSRVTFIRLTFLAGA